MRCELVRESRARSFWGNEALRVGPWHQGVDVFGLMASGNAYEQVPQVSVGLDTVHFAGADQASKAAQRPAAVPAARPGARGQICPDPRPAPNVCIDCRRIRPMAAHDRPVAWPYAGADHSALRPPHSRPPGARRFSGDNTARGARLICSHNSLLFRFNMPPRSATVTPKQGPGIALVADGP